MESQSSKPVRRWQRWLVIGIAAVGLGVSLWNISYRSPHVSPGIYPQPDTSFIGRRTQMRLPAEKADAAIIFIGGFGDVLTANFRAVYEGMPLLPGGGKQLRAYYAWDGAEGHLLSHDTDVIRDDVRAFLQCNPGADLVFVGHSYGGSAVMDVVRQLDHSTQGRIVVATLDAVSCRARSYPRERAEGVTYWVNVYCAPYRSLMDAAARIGGPWRECAQADANLHFSGEEKDAEGKRYRHSRPLPLFTEIAPQAEKSAQDFLFEACRQYGIGQTTHPSTK